MLWSEMTDEDRTLLETAEKLLKHVGQCGIDTPKADLLVDMANTFVEYQSRDGGVTAEDRGTTRELLLDALTDVYADVERHHAGETAVPVENSTSTGVPRETFSDLVKRHLDGRQS